MHFILVVTKLNFQHHNFSLQCHMILQNSQFIHDAAQETFLIIIINANIFLEGDPFFLGFFYE